MKKSRFTETQIVNILKEYEQGKKVVDLCREHGLSEQTFYNWKAKYGGMDVNELKELLNTHIFKSIDEVRLKAGSQYKMDYNYFRPHASLNYKTPIEMKIEKEKCCQDDYTADSVPLYR
jgi:transposase InsO family protein